MRTYSFDTKGVRIKKLFSSDPAQAWVWKEKCYTNKQSIYTCIHFRQYRWV